MFVKYKYNIHSIPIIYTEYFLNIDANDSQHNFQIINDYSIIQMLIVRISWVSLSKL